MWVSIIFLVLLPPLVSLQQQTETNREMVTRIREKGPNRDLAIYLKNLGDNITDAQAYTSYGVVMIPNCYTTGIGKESLCHFEKIHHTATGISGILTVSLGSVTGSYAAVIFSVPYNRISACNWFGVHLVKNAFPDEEMYNELYGMKGNDYTHSDTPTWKNITDGFYRVNVTMSHSTKCDMEIIISGGGNSKNDLVAQEPLSTAAVVGLITALLQLAPAVTPIFKTSIAVKFQVFNHHIKGGVTTDSYIHHGYAETAGGDAPLNGTSEWVFETTSGSWYGSSGMLTLHCDEWDAAPYGGGVVVWLYWYLPYSGSRYNNFAFEITHKDESAPANGEKRWMSLHWHFTSRSHDNTHLIYIERAPRQFAVAFAAGDVEKGEYLPGYIIQGTFNYPWLSVSPISIMKVDDVYRAMMQLMRKRKLHHLMYCNIIGYVHRCKRYHMKGVETMTYGYSTEVSY